MKKTVGHIMRISGLVIEMLGVWGVYSSTGGNDQARLPLPGGMAVSPAWAAVGLGFILWLAGTLLVYATRARRNPNRSDAIQP